MSELENRLQTSLGTQYRLERELGGGGMSRVFLAEETALGRKVVIKLLPPELAAVLSADRFQREVRLAAALQHPHIVPLLAAGSAGDILYYTMPFVEGESLRARMQREGELPVAEAVRLLREVVDALAYAHRQGIVHRDIKPENILLSQHHAVVTDFGIAKALSSAGGGATLTGTGLAIGTPAYMAPEQATGEAGVDHRADIYSLGALAYEMLAGEPPFRGSTAQALIAAQLTRTATPITELRTAVPAELAAVIHRSLEKRPADRFQRAEEMLAALEGFGSATPSGTLAPVAGPAREWSAPRLLGAYGIASAATLGLAWALRTLLGLPDWFFPAVVVLLAVGLPIVLLGNAALHHRLTLTRAVKGGIAAFSTLGLVTVAYMAMRLLGIGPVGSLVASGKLGARERVIIADFANSTRDPQLGPAVTQAFRVDFQQSKLVSPVEADYVRRVLRRMQRPDSVPVTLELGREVAVRGGFKAVVAGELQQVGPSVLVSAQLVNAASGEVLATARETAKDSTAILDAVDRVSKQLRERIGESLRSIRADAPLSEVTTGSLDALKKYSQALQLQYAGDNPGAIAMLEDAVAADSDFAMAWRKLGTTLLNVGERPARAQDALARAFAMREHLTFRERKLTENSWYSDGRGMMDSAMVALQSLLAEYPNDNWAANNLGVIYEASGNAAEAEKSYQRAAALEPENILAWGNIYSLRVAAGRFDSAAATLAHIKKNFPSGPSMDHREAVFELGSRDFGKAEPHLRELVRRYEANPTWRDVFLSDLAGVLALRGKLAEADRTLATLAELRAGRGDAGGALGAEAMRVVPAAMYLGDERGARARLAAVLKARPPEKLPEFERPLAQLVRAAVGVGDRELAGRLLEEIGRSRGNVPGRAWPYLKQMSRGQVLAMRSETFQQAVPELRKAALVCEHCAEVVMAFGFDRAGQPDSALAHFERWAETGEALWDVGVYYLDEPLAYFRMGELYEAKGDRTKAVDFYGRFTELWREADPELQGRVRTAKQRIADLMAERPKP